MQINGYIKPGRIIFLFSVFGLILVWILYSYAKLAGAQGIVHYNHTPEIQRGSIVDRNGKPLAVSANFYHFGVTPSSITDIPNFAKIIAPVINISPDTLAQTLTQSSQSSFIYIKKKIDQGTCEELKKICITNKFNAVRFDRIPGRVYPENSLASQLVGYMGNDGTGLAGIEYYMQDVLSPQGDDTSLDAIHGKNVYLTIDANLQFKLEKIMKAAMETTQAENLMLLAANCKTGEILSYISYPSSDLNEYTQAKAEETINRPAAESYEPGSVFKIFSVASFIDSGAIRADEVFVCDGIYKRRTSNGESITITCLDHHGPLTARDALKMSCNDALAQMSEKIETELFLSKIRSMGFGAKTGVEVPRETAGSVRTTQDRLWSARSKPTIAIGQEIAVSALQMVQAATAIANGGVPVKLTVINRIADSKGQNDYIHVPKYKERILKKSTADYILSCMETVAQSGTGTRANIGDISIGVKTGTAQMADLVHGGYSKEDFLSNCMAIFPIQDPEIVLYIVIEKAKGETYAGRIVAPVINQAANVIIDHLGMSRGSAASLAHNGRISIAGETPIQIKNEIPDFTGVSKRQLLPLLNRSDLHIKILGDGWVINQSPEPGTAVTENMEIELYLE